MICRTLQRCLESRVKILATGRKRERKKKKTNLAIIPVETNRTATIPDNISG